MTNGRRRRQAWRSQGAVMHDAYFSRRHATLAHLGCEIIVDADDAIAKRHQPRSEAARTMHAGDQLVAQAAPQQTTDDGTRNHMRMHNVGPAVPENPAHAEQED